MEEGEDGPVPQADRLQLCRERCVQLWEKLAGHMKFCCDIKSDENILRGSKFCHADLFPAFGRHVGVPEGAEDPSEQPRGPVVERVGRVRRRVQHGLQRVRAPRVEPQEVVPLMINLIKIKVH